MCALAGLFMSVLVYVINHNKLYTNKCTSNTFEPSKVDKEIKFNSEIIKHVQNLFTKVISAISAENVGTNCRRDIFTDMVQ